MKVKRDRVVGVIVIILVIFAWTWLMASIYRARSDSPERIEERIQNVKNMAKNVKDMESCIDFCFDDIVHSGDQAYCKSMCIMKYGSNKVKL